MLYLARASKEERMEACYKLYEVANWDLSNFRNDTDLFIEDVRKNAKEYADSILNAPLTKEQIWCLMPKGVKILFNQYDNILEEMIKDGVINKSQLKDIDWAEQNLRNLLREYCYNIWAKLQWIVDHINQYCLEHNLSYNTVYNLAYEYETKVLNYNEAEAEKNWDIKLGHRKKHSLDYNPRGIYSNLFNSLLQTNDHNEIIKLFVDMDRKYSSIKHGLTDFAISYKIPDEQKEDIFNKLNIYAEYLKENRRKEQEVKKIEKENKYLEENIDKARLTIKDYIGYQYDDINKYCADIGLERKVFDKYLDLIKDNDEELYNMYIKYLERIKNNAYEDLLARSLEVINLMKNGVAENGVKREFDLVDYFRYLPLGFDRMLRIVRDGINTEDYKLLSTYVGKYKNERELSEVEINNIYNMKTIVDVQFDEDNKVIPGSGREITKEEKQNIVNYLKYNNIPVTSKTYNIVYRRWLSGGLIIEKDKTK